MKNKILQFELFAIPAIFLLTLLWFTCGTYTIYIIGLGVLGSLFNALKEDAWLRLLAPFGILFSILSGLSMPATEMPIYTEWIAEQGTQWFKTTDYAVAIALAVPVVGYSCVSAYKQVYRICSGFN